MADETLEIQCPSCAHKFRLPSDFKGGSIICPHCEAEVPEEALRGEGEIAEELAPGFRPGRQLGNYVIEALLGAGGMAVVFRGKQLSLNRDVAIKTLPARFAQNKMFVSRFESEAAVLATLNHRNVVSVIDRGRDGEVYYIVMEYIRGKTLKDLLRQGDRLKPEDVLAIALQVLDGLGYAHKRGVVHRDIKPGNIMINQENEVKLADFGLAHLAAEQGGLDATRDNQAMGTLKYMAPEQLTSAKHVDGRADLYSFGVCLYEMLTAKLPLGTFPTPSEIDASLDMRWDDVILRILKTDPEDRYQTAEELSQALKTLADTPKVTAKEEAKAEEKATAEAAKKAKIIKPVCLQCNHLSSPASQSCEKCGADLADLFDSCPSCEKPNRIDLETCRHCGADLREYRAKKRKQVRALQAKAKKLASRHQYRTAIAEAEKILQFRTRDYASLRELAEEWISRVRKRLDQHEQRLYEAGSRMIAESHFESALKIWEPLADSYKDIGKQRTEIIQRKEAAEKALAEAGRLNKSGNLRGAVSAWEKAAAFWRHNKSLRKKLTEARIKLGNLNLKQTYLREAKKAEAGNDFHEALALVDRALELKPNDESALAYRKALQEKQARSTALGSDSAIQLALQTRRQAKRRKPMGPVGWAILGSVIGVVLILLLIFGVYLPQRRSNRESEAKSLLRQATEKRGNGLYGEAQNFCRSILKDYSQSQSAAPAQAMFDELEAALDNASSICDALDTTAREGGLENLDKAFQGYRNAAGDPPISTITTYQQYARQRIEKLRREIALLLADQAVEFQRKQEWHAALERYETAVKKYEYEAEPVSSGLATAQKRVTDTAEEVKAGKAAADREDWSAALTRCRNALNLIPGDPDASELLRRIAKGTPPPSGMVLVPSGKYIVGGSKDHPKRTVWIQYPFYIDRAEVTNSRYAEFVVATGRSAPAHWSEGGQIPSGAEEFPVTHVTWEDAAAFAKWAGGRLPTEVEWECAARGQDGRFYSWGNAWQPTSAVLGFGLANVGLMDKDCSPVGCFDMVGNVAEWTATPCGDASPREAVEEDRRPDPLRKAPPARKDVPPRDPPLLIRKGPLAGKAVPLRKGFPLKTASPEPPEASRFIVKGNSWAGVELERSTTVVRENQGGKEKSLVLTPNTEYPDLSVTEGADIHIGYLQGFSSDSAHIGVSKWSPEWRQWLSSSFSVKMGEKIGEEKLFRYEEQLQEKRVLTQFPFDLSTGCTAVSQDAAAGTLIIRDSSGVIRVLPKHKGRWETTPTLDASQRVDVPKRQIAKLQVSARHANRMLGGSTAAYINVGFRIMKPLWVLPQQPAK